MPELVFLDIREEIGFDDLIIFSDSRIGFNGTLMSKNSMNRIFMMNNEGIDHICLDYSLWLYILHLLKITVYITVVSWRRMLHSY